MFGYDTRTSTPSQPGWLRMSPVSRIELAVGRSAVGSNLVVCQGITSSASAD